MHRKLLEKCIWHTESSYAETTKFILTVETTIAMTISPTTTSGVIRLYNKRQSSYGIYIFFKSLKVNGLSSKELRAQDEDDVTFTFFPGPNIYQCSRGVDN